MPISAEKRKLYPKAWKQISEVIRFGRAEGRCECRGECGDVHSPSHGGRCTRLHGFPIPGNEGQKTVLTVAHLDHNQSTAELIKLKAMCQRCHLLYDRGQHQKNASATRDRRRGQLSLGI